MYNAVDFLAAIVPAAANLALPVEPKPGQCTRIAVLCAPNFDDQRPLDECIHWLPGWLGIEIDDPEMAFQDAVTATKENEEGLLDDLVDALRKADEDIKDTISEQIEEVTEKFRALYNMQCWFWERHQVVVRDVPGDGNCGVEMVMNFSEDGSHHVKPGERAPREDLLPVLHAYRLQLKEHWLKVRFDPDWQQMWVHLCGGRMDLHAWARAHLSKQETTPQKRKRIEGLPFTPDRVQGGSLIADGDPMAESFTVPGGRDWLSYPFQTIFGVVTVCV